MLVKVERLDVHPGDLYGRKFVIEMSGLAMLSGLLLTVLEPFLAAAGSPLNALAKQV